MSAIKPDTSGATAKSAPEPPILSSPAGQYQYIELVLLAAAVGVLAACGNLGFRSLIHLCSWFFLGVEWRALGIGGGLGRGLIPLILMSGGVCILALDYLFPGDVLGYGFPNFLEMVNLGNARIHRRWIFVKGAGAALSLGSGASVGREGPIAQIGGAIGSAVAQLRRLSVDRAKVLVAAGAGAGIATTFNAPMGGLMFAQEIVLLGHTELSNLTLLLVSTFSAVLTERALMGDSGAVFHPLPFVVRTYWEMTTYGGMGVALGLLAAGYIRFFHAAGARIRQLAIPPWARLMGGLGVVGVIAAFLPDNLSDGYPVIERAFRGELGLELVASLMVAKFVASTISLDCGAPGGVFGPIFFIGATAGGAFHDVCRLLAPGLTGPHGSYALVAMGAFLGAVTHAPLTALFLLFEMTRGDWTVALPAMVATLGAVLVSHWIEPESIDSYALAREGKTLAFVSHERSVLRQLPVASVMSADATVVRSNSPLPDVLAIAGDTGQATLPVLDSDGRLAGLIVTRDLLALLASGAEVGPLVNAYDLGRPNPPTVTPESSLDDAVQSMEYEALDELPVVDHARAGAFAGIVSRRAIAQAVNRVSLSLSPIASREREIFWATGYRISRITIPRAAAGKTLRRLDPRARFNVNVLAVEQGGDSDSGFTPISPDRALAEGDLIIAAGRPSDLRRFLRDLETA
ncbi:MAG TPA: chloride channel protein [Candidatus Binataceae bacterium]|nr:chloride channel protein [Candidatus Binataceae bacterium]